MTLRLAAVNCGRRVTGGQRLDAPRQDLVLVRLGHRLRVGEAQHGPEVHARRLPDLLEDLLGVGHAGNGDRDLVLPGGLHLRTGHAQAVDPEVQDVDRLVEIGLADVCALGRVDDRDAAGEVQAQPRRPLRGEHGGEGPHRDRHDDQDADQQVASLSSLGPAPRLGAHASSASSPCSPLLGAPSPLPKHRHHRRRRCRPRHRRADVAHVGHVVLDRRVRRCARPRIGSIFRAMAWRTKTILVGWGPSRFPSSPNAPVRSV